ncbi:MULTISPECIES: sialate O-acetylesterase [unclassified Chryseobacterium]|uniref:sialate O-acetylesterase n=1 Tax=unclassified Chryseobacterium TaxID=2593645 RepID=UPI000D37D119|nr:MULTISPECIES: sialate O-acetylesterase [unclassified Chryseobacterium]PTT76916.1 sialate O-acetylesterase [Chryseobacterium sp. HMWF001]PVV55998.1 sialate O-acetylesterase [Chryseobacterium sp. HMWF035]
MNYKNIKILTFLLCICCTLLFEAKIKLPALVSDGMILQRNQKLNIWGKADPNEKVDVKFLSKNYKTTADQNGNWKILLPEQKAGGPYTMTINEITLKDILIGDVWLASGQSNMELPMRRLTPLYSDEIKNANNQNIRFFTVPQKYNFKSPQTELEGGKWEATNPQTILNFSGVAYFFAKDVSEKNKVPVGIIHASLGGSPIQAWMDENSLKKYPDYLDEAKKWQNDELIKSTESSEQALSKAWYTELDQSDIGLNQHWEKFDLNDSDWKTMKIPGSWEDTEGSFEGSVWFRKEIILTKNQAGKTAFLNLGRIKDADVTYINGIKVGNVTYEYPPRWYDVPAGILKEGKNVIAVRISNGSGKGQFIADKPYYLEIDGQKIDLKSEWKYKIGAKMAKMAPGTTFIRWKPTGLYNAMINPLINYNITGAIWYQGESNTGKPKEYGDLLTTMITDWRNKFNNKEMPFITVQLANFMESKAQPIESNWAELRDQQRKVSLQVPNAGLAVIIDIGEWNDIHPLNKKTVGDRLALQAMKLAYGKNIVADGPVYQSMKIDGNKIVLSFKNGTDDFAPVVELKGFAIKNAGGNWSWAKAKIQGKTIVVWNDSVTDPVAVRYDWADNPDGNLKNKTGLPASPFTTE